MFESFAPLCPYSYCESIVTHLEQKSNEPCKMPPKGFILIADSRSSNLEFFCICTEPPPPATPPPQSPSLAQTVEGRDKSQTRCGASFLIESWLRSCLSAATAAAAATQSLPRLQRTWNKANLHAGMDDDEIAPSRSFCLRAGRPERAEWKTISANRNLNKATFIWQPVKRLSANYKTKN